MGNIRLGMNLPEDWRVGEMRDLAEKISKGTNKKQKYVKERKLPFIKGQRHNNEVDSVKILQYRRKHNNQ